MATSRDLRSIALSLVGTTEAPHFDRIAFKAVRNYATLAADGSTANLKFTPDEQEFKCMMAPEAFAPVPNAWGKRGWTTADFVQARHRGAQGRTRGGVGACCAEETQAPVSHQAISDAGKKCPPAEPGLSTRLALATHSTTAARYTARLAPQN
jgi:hypothetical protein